MKHFAISSNKPCKICGKNHGYITYAHRIIIADENSKLFMHQFCAKHPDSKVVEVDLQFLIKKRILLIDIMTVLKRQVPSESTHGTSG